MSWNICWWNLFLFQFAIFCYLFSAFCFLLSSLCLLVSISVIIRNHYTVLICFPFIFTIKIISASFYSGFHLSAPLFRNIWKVYIVVRSKIFVRFRDCLISISLYYSAFNLEILQSDDLWSAALSRCSFSFSFSGSHLYSMFYF